MINLEQEKYLYICQDNPDISSVVNDTFKEHYGSVPIKVFKQSLIRRLNFDPSEIIGKEKFNELRSQGNLGGKTFFYPITNGNVNKEGFYRI